MCETIPSSASSVCKAPFWQQAGPPSENSKFPSSPLVRFLFLRTSWLLTPAWTHGDLLEDEGVGHVFGLTLGTGTLDNSRNQSGKVGREAAFR